jgi:crossover junction endodeoxyribonuclease RusA
MVLVEFAVFGTPVSYQSNNRELLRRWEERVRTAAEAAWPANTLPVSTDCLLVVVYFFSRPIPMIDNDNLIKPIQDALIGLVYQDDRQVTDSVIRRTDVQGSFFLQDQSEVLLTALRGGDSFVYVRVEDAPDHRSLL